MDFADRGGLRYRIGARAASDRGRRVSGQGPGFARLFNPRSIAVIGASQDLSSISGNPIKHLLAQNYAGTIYPVNPRYIEVAGLKCYADVAALPQVPDVAVVAVAASRALEAIRQIGEKGIPFALVLTSGFAEAGGDGEAAQAELADLARRYGLRVIGPNCQGYMNIADRISVGFGAPFAASYPAGGVSLCSQSGAFGSSIVMMASAEGIGFRRYVSTGNESVTTTLDLFADFITDPETRVIGAYVEGLKDAQRLIGIARDALRAGKPILVWKVGNSEVGARAARSHTANLGGAPALYRAAFHQGGIVEVGDVGDFADCAKALLPGLMPRGNRIAIVTISGGAGIVMADRATAAGLDLPRLEAGTEALLREVLPSYATIANPMDVTGGVLNDPTMLKATLEAVARDPNVDMIGLALAAASGGLATEFAREIVRIAEAFALPVFVAWNADPAIAGEAYAILDAAGIARYGSPVRAARGAGALWQFARARQRQAVIDREVPLSLARPAVRAALSARPRDPTEHEAKKILSDYGIAGTREIPATTAEEAMVAAAKIGFPVVMKILSPDIAHKTEAGGVRLGIADRQATGEAFTAIVAAARAYAPSARIDGILVQEMVGGATEVILGVKNDPLFGPAILFGLGGIFAEVMRDVSFRLAPLTLSEAEEMIREIRAFPVLDGARGRPRGDVAALADAIVRLAALALDLGGEVSEIDINPLFVLPAGQGVKAGDALITLRRPGQGS